MNDGQFYALCGMFLISMLVNLALFAFLAFLLGAVKAATRQMVKLMAQVETRITNTADGQNGDGPAVKIRPGSM